MGLSLPMAQAVVELLVKAADVIVIGLVIEVAANP